MTYLPLKIRPSSLSKAAFVETYGGIYEHSPQFAEAVWDQSSPNIDTVEGLFHALKAAVDAATPEQKLALVRAHPDLASRPAFTNALSAQSMSEQSSAGLTRKNDPALEEFATLNAAYKAKFGFPFIVAVRGLTRDEILAQFRTRLGNDRETEFDTALAEIHKIAHLRLLNLSA
jgi:OHCU decarboxylase